MSLGLHRYWRRRAVTSLLARQGTRFLDLGCGTGDVMLAILQRNRTVSVTGIDPSPDMLAVARAKLRAAKLESRGHCQAGDATALTPDSASFDGVVCAFCLRNIENRSAALREMRRVVRPGGTLAILELSVPRHPILKVVHRLHTRRIIPLLGRWLSQGSAYRYLADSIDHFPAPSSIVAELTRAGFGTVKAQSLTGGFVTLFTAQVPLNAATPLRFAAPAYANSVPLAQFIPEVCPGAELILDYPARLLDPLLDGRVDAALMPVADLLAHPALDMIAGLGIGTEHRVRSVLLRCNRPLKEIRTVKLDPASHTSNALARILLELHWKQPVRIVEGLSEDTADAAVVIGDRALCEPEGQGGDYDLASAWHAMTGLPFVFAVWAFRRNHPYPDRLAEVVRQAKQAGLAALPELVRQQAAKLNLSEPFCLHYFTHCIRYDLGPQHREAIDRFRTLMARGTA